MHLPERLEHRMRFFRVWLLPFSVLLGAAFATYALTFFLDVSDEKYPENVLRLLWQPNPATALQTLSNAAEVVAAVLAIAITVVAIVVELAANRYTHRITELFVGSATNFAVMGFFAVTAVQCLWVAETFDAQGPGATGFFPVVGTRVALAMLTMCLLMLLPYFAFVFAFLNPIAIVDRIRSHAMRIVQRRVRTPLLQQREAVRAVEQLADVAMNAMTHQDKAVAMASIDALMRMAIEYQSLRNRLRSQWFVVGERLAHNPDFVSMAPEVLRAVGRRQVWFEMKILRQYQALFGHALNQHRDVNYLIAINTRVMGQQGLLTGNHEFLSLVIKFFNTYLRATINAHDVRTAYNILNQYRLLAEHLLEQGQSRQALRIASYFKYYGLVSFGSSLPFILETVAYDLCTLNEKAHALRSSVADAMLSIFLEVDRESSSEIQERSLHGVRKAQVKLATYYLMREERQLARRIYSDMEAESPERLAQIRDELLGTRTPEFWEISDRGVNFDYVPESQHGAIREFFSWFGDGVPRNARMPSLPAAPPETGET